MQGNWAAAPQGHTQPIVVLLLCRWSSIKSIWIGMSMTFFTMFDVPVFWPILLLYWLLLFTVTMKRQIKHMIKYRYLPFTLGKKVCHSHAAATPATC